MNEFNLTKKIFQRKNEWFNEMTQWNSNKEIQKTWTTILMLPIGHVTWFMTHETHNKCDTLYVIWFNH